MGALGVNKKLNLTDNTWLWGDIFSFKPWPLNSSELALYSTLPVSPCYLQYYGLCVGVSGGLKGGSNFLPLNSSEQAIYSSLPVSPCYLQYSGLCVWDSPLPPLYAEAWKEDLIFDGMSHSGDSNQHRDAALPFAEGGKWGGGKGEAVRSLGTDIKNNIVSLQMLVELWQKLPLWKMPPCFYPPGKWCPVVQGIP